MNNQDINTLILFSFRDCISRKTSVPWKVIRIIIKHIDELEPTIARLIEREVREEYMRDPGTMELNDRDWLHLLSALESHDKPKPIPE